MSGKAFDAFLEERIFDPLKMRDTTFNPDAAQRERVVQLYDRKDGGPLVRIEQPNIPDDASLRRVPNPSGGLISTAADVFRFYQTILNGGEIDGVRIVSQETVALMTSVQTGDLKTGFTPGNGWGLGWCVVRQPQGVSGMLSPGSFGHGGAWGTQVWVDPKREMVFVLMIQRKGLPNSDASDIRKDFQQLAVDTLAP